MGVTQLLQRAGPRTAALEALLQQELAELAGDQQRLSLVRQLLQQQQQEGQQHHLQHTGSPAAPAAAPNSAAGSGSHSLRAAQEPIRVLPLLGLTLTQLVSHLQQQLQQQDSANARTLPLDATPLQSGGTPLTAALGYSSSSDSSSPFLLALHAEVQRLRQLVAGCYVELEETVAAIGQQLQPVQDSSSTSEGDRAAAGLVLARRRSVRVSSLSRQLSIDAVAAAAQSARRSGSVLDITLLQARAAAVSQGLVHLDDFVSNSTAQLAHLAIQYDTLLTAAAAAESPASIEDICSGSSSAGDAASAAAASGSAAAGASRAGHLRGVLGRWHRGKKQQQLQDEGKLHAGQQQAVQHMLMTPGVCSHSSSLQASRYIAGVRADVYHQALHKLLTLGCDSEPALWGLSVVYSRLRYTAEVAAAATAAAGAERGAAVAPAAPAGATEWTAPDEFTRATTKYWVQPGHVMRLKLALLRHLPLLVYGAADPVYRGDISSRAALLAGSNGVTSLVSSVYFDSPQLDVYHTRLAREDGARLVRVRYYGPRQTGPGSEQQPVFVERKTHREKCTGERSVKERAALVQGQLPAFLAGQLPESAEGSKLKLMQQVQEFLAEWQQSPALRTEYYRTAWQRYDSNSVRLSLDEHMLLLREGAQQGQWCTDLEARGQLPCADAVRFPYGILEIKLQEEAPCWVRELELSGILIQVQRFSKFIHGMALLHPRRCGTLPSWLLWDAAAGCVVPAGLEEMQAISEERIAMKQQEADAFPAAQTASVTASVSSSAPPPASTLPEETTTLAPLMIPRLSINSAAPALNGARAADAASITTHSTRAAGAAAVAAVPAAASYVPLLEAHAEHDDVVHGAGKHAPVHGCVGAAGEADFAPAGSSSYSSNRGSGVGGSRAAWLGDGVSPFSAGSSSSWRTAQEEAASMDACSSAGAIDVSSGASAAGAAGPQNTAVAAFQIDQKPQRQLSWRGSASSTGTSAALQAGHRARTSKYSQPAEAANLQQLPPNAPGAAAAQQHMIQVNCALQDPATAYVLERAPMPVTASFEPVQEQSTLNPSRQLPGLLPPAGASQAVVAAAAAAQAAATKDLERGGSTGSKERRGRRLGRPLLRLQQLKAAGRRLRGETGAAAKAGAGMSKQLPGFSGGRQRGGPAGPTLVKTRVEPKTFFANERTFLAWLQIAVLVMMTGLGLLSGSSSLVGGVGGAAGAAGPSAVNCLDSMACSAARVSGAIIASISVLFMVYALYLFKKRNNQIITRSTLRYDDQRGPVALTVLLLVVTLVSVILALKSWKEQHD